MDVKWFIKILENQSIAKLNSMQTISIFNYTLIGISASKLCFIQELHVIIIKLFYLKLILALWYPILHHLCTF